MRQNSAVFDQPLRLTDLALALLRGWRAGRLVREATNRLEDLLGLLEVGEMSGFPDRHEPATRERGGVGAPVGLRGDLVALTPDRRDRRWDEGEPGSRRFRSGSCLDR